jgi:hypothetical protein
MPRETIDQSPINIRHVFQKHLGDEDGGPDALAYALTAGFDLSPEQLALCTPRHSRVAELEAAGWVQAARSFQQADYAGWKAEERALQLWQLHRSPFATMSRAEAAAAAAKSPDVLARKAAVRDQAVRDRTEELERQARAAERQRFIDRARSEIKE